MRHLGEDIRAAKGIFEFTHGEQEANKEVNVKVWMDNATRVVGELRVNTFQEALELIKSIPILSLEDDSRI